MLFRSTLDTLRNLCYTAKDGVSLLAISDAAEQLGFKTVGGRLTFNKLEKEALLPCIVHWKQEHFVVVCKIKSKNIFRKQAKLFVADPAHGLVSFTADEFKRIDGKPEIGKTQSVSMQRLQSDSSGSPSKIVSCKVI